MKTLFTVLSASSSDGDGDEDTKMESFSSSWGDAQFSRPFPSGYACTANLLVELVCPECVPVCPWPDEDFLKYTIERYKEIFVSISRNPFLWKKLF